MKKLLALLSIVGLLFITEGCVVKKTVVVKKDNGKHLGWYKNKHNPHHPSHNKTKVIVIDKDNGKGNNDGKGDKGGKGNKGGKGKKK